MTRRAACLAPSRFLWSQMTSSRGKMWSSGTTRSVLLVLAEAALLLSGCTASGTGGSSSPTAPGTRTTIVGTRPPPGAQFTPAAPSTRKPLRPGAKAHPGERNGTCPYIKTGLNEDNGKGVNLADIEGDRVYRTTVLTELRPVGCRFYFIGPPYEAVAEIRPQTFATATEAHNGMVLTARTGAELIVEKNFVKGVDGISFKTKFFGPDGKNDWAFVFAKGPVLVTVFTQRKDTSRNAFYLAQAIARKF